MKFFTFSDVKTFELFFPALTERPEKFQVSIEEDIFKTMFSQREVTSLKIEIEIHVLQVVLKVWRFQLLKKDVSSTFICLP